jgi:hypothetical protein
MKDGSMTGDVRRVAGEIEVLRGDIGSLVSELDRRRHELFDLRLQAKRHPVVVMAAAATAALVVGGLLAVAVRARRDRHRPSVRAREVRDALARLLDHPDRVAAETSVLDKVLAAAGVAAGTTLARRLVNRMVAPTVVAAERRPVRSRPVHA